MKKRNLSDIALKYLKVCLWVLGIAWVVMCGMRMVYSITHGEWLVVALLIFLLSILAAALLAAKDYL